MQLWYSVTSSQFTLSLEHLPCTELKGIGPKVAQYLKRLNINTVQDLLFHLPSRYEDRTHFKTLNLLQLGDHVQVEGQIVYAMIKQGRRRTLEVRIEDKDGYLTLRFFNFTTHQYQMLNSHVNLRLHCYGEVRRGMIGYEMIHPEYSFPKENQTISPIQTLTAVYSTTEGLHQYTLRKIIDRALALLDGGVTLQEHLPDKILQLFNLPNLLDAIRYVHRPPADADQNLLQQGLHLSQQRLVFEELLAHQISLSKIKIKIKKFQAPQCVVTNNLVEIFLRKLPYQLTNAQQKVFTEILHDLNGSAPMLRLVQGDVGSGKTVVAALAGAYMIQAGFQVAIMAPTELLAEQHYHNFSLWFENLGVNVVWLTSAIRGKAREEILRKVALKETNIIIGTHALFQKEVQFAKLGLVIIDEQHRFGVHQRLALLSKGIELNMHPHQLIMSATPIPRTLAMTAYADLDCSTIDELPPGRTPVRTIVLPNTRREELIERIKDNCSKGAQAYWVCTLIQESEVLQCQAAENIAKELMLCLPQLTINLVHGRMKSREKESIMTAFKNKEIDLLVATTVIEVGVDVPNASLMVIENAERLGLAQLHQLRGRVGRGTLQSHCVLMYQPPLSKIAEERLSVLRDHNDGFIIAQKDLELRGPGEVLGTRQTGLVQFKIANLTRDQSQLPIIQKAAEIVLKDYPEQVEPLVARWLANNDQFSEV